MTPADVYHSAYDFLHAGQYQPGFAAFESRWHPEAMATLPEPFTKLTATPVWQGQSLFGKSVLVQMEMGYGDCIQFARFLPLLKVLGASRIVVLQTKSLHYLLAEMACIDHLTNDEHQGESQTCDYWIGSMSLAHMALNSPPYARALFPIGPDQVVSSSGYFSAEPSGILPLVGVNWSASNRYLHGVKSVTAEDLAQLTGTQCYSLNPEQTGPFVPLPADGWTENWAQTARHMRAMRAVVTVDTGTAHLAGALGVPCVVLLPEHKYICWRWKNARWYDSVITVARDQWSQVPALLKGILQ
jgi:hypothetical protein